MVKVTSLLAKAEVDIFGVKAWTEMEIRSVKGMYILAKTSLK